MKLSDLLTSDAILPSLHAQSKKQVLQEVCAAAARLTLRTEREIFDTLLQRERLGSTGVGQGVAIPHGKLRGLDRLVGVFARLTRPVDFDSLDDQPVDLVFVLLAPEGAGADHLKALARIARILRDPAMAQKLRTAQDASGIYSVLTGLDEASHAA
jgi:PTS system nitrogen regulatory IIA component